MFNTIVGAGAASRYGSDQMMRLLAALAPQHCKKELYKFQCRTLVPYFSKKLISFTLLLLLPLGQNM
jgi:hypothetical protein